MQTSKTLILAGVAAALLTGCATKRYPIATPMGLTEQSTMTCRELDLELIRSEEVRTQIVKTATMDWRSVAGFLGDYGIGNAMAKNDAEKALNARIVSIRAAKVAKSCPIAVSAAEQLRAWFEGLLG